MSGRHWRIGAHYGIHVYEGDTPIATFHDKADAVRAVDAFNAAEAQEGEPVADRDAWAIVSPETGRIIVSSVRSTREAALLCWWRDNKIDAEVFWAAGFRCVPVGITATPPRGTGTAGEGEATSGPDGRRGETTC